MPLPDGYSGKRTEDADYLRYLQALTKFSEWLHLRGYAIAYFPTQVVADRPVIARIHNQVRVLAGSWDGAPIDISEIWTLEELVGQLRRSEFVVATRFHGALISLILEKPVVAIAYHRKSRELMESVGESRFVVDWRRCDLEPLQSRFLELERARAEGASLARPDVEGFRAVLARQYDELVALARSRT